MTDGAVGEDDYSSSYMGDDIGISMIDVGHNIE